ncbi:hypothetical protein TREMEDRAFT_64658 [Tremella mesenterica DSM 1558]|uniref:uncharacterized protein n=1 Tax=Tremella mesenterica (strain ATCC 24925 / CBS 8224 / DSM 1558 / NBRC 9311 / NRRL Y-6157 / RJB 2259-6 / UBC 559-6) TaxID=578456 RepID=UPI0003F4A239|nr:uncharacterized protein TREMEDRAFT_64658 [Tremella mesenterica DSM 1558]EIW67404.1 hypothetical protein TREMEDRAFT_64658 [Tremella mesenterica DSM 1558]
MTIEVLVMVWTGVIIMREVSDIQGLYSLPRAIRLMDHMVLLSAEVCRPSVSREEEPTIVTLRFVDCRYAHERHKHAVSLSCLENISFVIFLGDASLRAGVKGCGPVQILS